MNIGRSIRNIRTENNMSQEEFAEIFFVTRQTVSNWENEKSYPDLNTIVKISDEFGVSLDSLLKGDREMINEISEKAAIGRKWNKIRRIVCTVTGMVVVGTILLLIIENVIWHIRKDKLERYFNDTVYSLGFTESDERYYILEKNGITYTLPHQEMPSFWDFTMDFHAKHLDCHYENDLYDFNIRLSGDMYSLRITDKFNEQDYYIRIDENGNILSDKELPEFVRKQYFDNADRIKSIISNGMKIYKQVYAD